MPFSARELWWKDVRLLYILSVVSFRTSFLQDSILDRAECPFLQLWVKFSEAYSTLHHYTGLRWWRNSDCLHWWCTPDWKLPWFRHPNQSLYYIAAMIPNHRQKPLSQGRTKARILFCRSMFLTKPWPKQGCLPNCHRQWWYGWHQYAALQHGRWCNWRQRYNRPVFTDKDSPLFTATGMNSVSSVCVIAEIRQGDRRGCSLPLSRRKKSSKVLSISRIRSENCSIFWIYCPLLPLLHSFRKSSV